MDGRLKGISKLLSLVLRHQPERFGVQLDREGWVDVDVLLAALAQAGKTVSKDDLEAVVATNDKQRFARVDNRIRANQGHSIGIDLNLAPAEPPPTLFHGTATRHLNSILATGLERRSRQHVHLSSDRETAIKVGSRHGKPVVLEVAASDMVADGAVFYRSANGVWLTASVSPKYLRVL